MLRQLQIAKDSRLLQAKPDLEPFLRGDGPCFPQNLNHKDHGGAEFSVAAFKVPIQPEVGWSTSYNGT